MTNKLHVLFPSSWGIRWSFQSLVGLLVAVLVIGAIYLTGESKQLLEEEDETKHQINNGSSSISQCDLFSGKWVLDNESHPLYKEKDCSFMSDQLACQKFGREDLRYQSWRWQPHRCDLPRYFYLWPLLLDLCLLTLNLNVLMEKVNLKNRGQSLCIQMHIQYCSIYMYSFYFVKSICKG